MVAERANPVAPQTFSLAAGIYADAEDADLVRRSRNADQSAFEVLLRRYDRAVYNTALRMLRNPEDARDVPQTVFLKTYEHLADYDPKYRFYSWIYRIAVNESLNGLQRRHAVQAVDEQAADERPGPDQAVVDEQRSRCVQGALMHLKPDYRVVIVLKHFLGCSYHDMSEILQVPEKTVKSRLFTARQQLKDALTAQGITSP
jgi:RNA polymerase sigma-70 factor (ECF subfamily)